MTLKNKSIFNLIEIFTNSRKKIVNTINTETHCEQKHIHDFYCDAEKPFVS
ncbi:hypothetical protein ADIWIN_2717 [Winogradskyella psychrotolerans RS-3]|uniref:Uncharacterized protein n=1 Tax=Winogradskyella psychrotolerans RS-3 TaxID=641526 RepID=S7VSA4_9FLAO|nr:hypothetical protein [Winogradskyella psychrotolerans]EPR72217.1 hypothetical protein ADIWIN_2717 [Winogradskyella psychrotolerans RS-3]